MGYSVACFVPSLTCTAHLLNLLVSLACSIHGLTHPLHSLPRGTVGIHRYVFTLKSRFMKMIEIFVISRYTPRVANARHEWRCSGELRSTCGWWFCHLSFPSSLRTHAEMNESRCWPPGKTHKLSVVLNICQVQGVVPRKKTPKKTSYFSFQQW